MELEISYLLPCFVRPSMTNFMTTYPTSGLLTGIGYNLGGNLSPSDVLGRNMINPVINMVRENTYETIASRN